MTLPSERTRAVLRARDFLFRLSSPYGGGIKGISKEVRREAISILRHYPGWHDFVRPEQFDADAAEAEGRRMVLKLCEEMEKSQ